MASRLPDNEPRFRLYYPLLLRVQATASATGAAEEEARQIAHQSLPTLDHQRGDLEA